MGEEPENSAGNEGDSQNGLNLPSGTIVGGNYIIFDCLGIRGDSAVYKCRHKDLAGPFLAMKLLHPSLASDSVAAARFHQEVVSSYNVTHPNVVRTHEFISEGTTIAYTMEYMEYGTLKERLEQEDPLHIEDIIIIATQICQGLEAIHNAGIVHRNIKPGNIFFSSDGTIKIADFGIARASSGPKLTSHGEVLGTVGYASPEYLETGEVDQRSDIYALGMILYEMITEKYPFSNANPVESIRLRLTTDPVSPSEIRTECPLELSNVVLKALSRSPSERYQSVQEMIEELGYLGIAASVNSGSYTPRDPLDDIISDDITEPYVEQGYDLEDFQKPIGQALASQVKRRLAIGALLSGVLMALIFALLTAVRPGSSSGKTLQEIDDAAEAKPPIEAAERTQTIVEKPKPEPKPEPKAAVRPKDRPLNELKSFFGLDKKKAVTPPVAAQRSYVVVQGDTINEIAQRFSVSPLTLMELNKVSDPRRLEVGRTLVLPQ